MDSPLGGNLRSNPEQSDCGTQVMPIPAGDEFNVFVPGRDRCDDWASLDEALDQAVAFLGLGCRAVTIEARCRS